MPRLGVLTMLALSFMGFVFVAQEVLDVLLGDSASLASASHLVDVYFVLFCETSDSRSGEHFIIMMEMRSTFFVLHLLVLLFALLCLVLWLYVLLLSILCFQVNESVTH